MTQPRTHLALVTGGVMQRLRHGHKRLELRLSTRPHPARLARVGDELVFKLGRVVGAFATITRVDVIASLATLKPLELTRTYSGLLDEVGFDPAYIDVKTEAHHAVVLHLGRVVPVAIDATALPSPRMAWVNGVALPAVLRRELREQVGTWWREQVDHDDDPPIGDNARSVSFVGTRSDALSR